MLGNTWGKESESSQKVHMHDSNVVVVRVKLYLSRVVNRCAIAAASTASPNKVLSSSLT